MMSKFEHLKVCLPYTMFPTDTRTNGEYYVSVDFLKRRHLFFVKNSDKSCSVVSILQKNVPFTRSETKCNLIRSVIGNSEAPGERTSAAGIL